MSHIPMKDHWKRFGMALCGTWREEYNPNDALPKAGRGYWGMIGHSGWNVVVEQLRAWKIWNRGSKTQDDLPYDFP